MSNRQNATFVPSATPCGTIRNETRFDPPSSLRSFSRLRRPRVARWPDCSPCTCGRSERAVVVLRATPDADDKPETDGAPETWLSGVKEWFHSKKDGNANAQTTVDGEGCEHHDGIAHESTRADDLDAEDDANSVSAKPEAQKTKFQWPWQKDGSFSDEDELGENRKTDFQWPWQKPELFDLKKEEKPDTTLKQGKRTKSSHSGVTSKRTINNGAPRNPLARKFDSDSKHDNPLEEQVGKILDVIVPTLQKLKPDSKPSGESEDNDPPERSTEFPDDGSSKAEKKEEPKAKRSGSVRDLYSPPSSNLKNADPKRSSSRPVQRSLLPRMPWSKKQTITTSDDSSDTQQKLVDSPGTKSADVDGPQTTASDNLDPDRLTSRKEKNTGVVSEKETNIGTDQEPGSEKQRDKTLAATTWATQKKVPHADMSSIPQRDVAMIRLIFGSETFFATETLSAPGGLIFRGNLRGEPKTTLSKLEKRLSARLGDKYTLCLAEGEEDLRPVVVVIPTARDKRPATPRQKIFAVFAAVATLSACVGRGAYVNYHKDVIEAYYGPLPRSSIIEKLFYLQTSSALVTAVAIAGVLFISQVVQRIVASRSGTRLALPCPIPSYQLGSFGVITHLASPPPSRSALFDIALSGAATVVILSLGLLVVGLRMSTTFSGVTPVPISMVSSSVIIGFLTQHVPQGKILIDYSRSLIGLHPLAIIGANCLTIGALNLLPIRQIDGGRIISALYGRKTSALAARVTVLFILFASSKSPFFVVFLVAITFGPWTVDRPAKNELTEPNGLRTLLGYLFMLVMIGVLLPYPRCKFFGTL